MNELGFASSNIVFGISGYNYQFVTRDTYNFAIKATYSEINGKPVEIFKAPLQTERKNPPKDYLLFIKKTRFSLNRTRICTIC